MSVIFCFNANASNTLQKHTPASNMYFHAGVHATESQQKDAIRSPNKRPPTGALWCPIEDSPQATTTSALLPFRRHRTSLSLSSQGYPIVSIDPSSISNPRLHAAARPGVMRFYESQSGLCALDLPRSAFLFVFQRQWLPHEYSRGFKK